MEYPQFRTSKKLDCLHAKHEALKVIYNGAILPQMLHAVWIEASKRDATEENMPEYED